MTSPWHNQRQLANVLADLLELEQNSTSSCFDWDISELKILRILKIPYWLFDATRPKPPYGWQSLAGSAGKDTVRWAHFGVFSMSHFVLDWTELYDGRDVTNRRIQLTSFGTKNVTSPIGGSNWPLLVQKTWRHQQGDPSDLLWCKKRDVTATSLPNCLWKHSFNE